MIMEILNQLTKEMIAFYAGDPNHIQHFIKVHSFAKFIGESERLDKDTLFTLEAAALVHDIGIKAAIEKIGHQTGKLQEELGPAPAREMLSKLGFETDVIDRVCYLIAHHHTYTNVDGIDYQILLEADFLVNLFEGNESKDAVVTALDHIFKTKCGIDICKTMFDV